MREAPVAGNISSNRRRLYDSVDTAIVSSYVERRRKI